MGWERQALLIGLLGRIGWGLPRESPSSLRAGRLSAAVRPWAEPGSAAGSEAAGDSPRGWGLGAGWPEGPQLSRTGRGPEERRLEGRGL
ncbi:hypothetical protein ADK46_03730, partial [Streptomyces rimosus subsp. rimosus]